MKLNPCRTVVTPLEEAIVFLAIQEIESEHGPMSSTDKPRHLGNYQFSFANVPLAVALGIQEYAKERQGITPARTLYEKIQEMLQPH